MFAKNISLNKRVNAMSGFTLVESLVAMAIFSIGFSGLYFLYNYAQVAITRSEQRMYLNLMGDRILQTIASEAQRPATDPLNPFKSPDKYSGSLVNCNGFSNTPPNVDFRYDWCNELVQNIGPFDSKSNLDKRQIDVRKDVLGNLIIEVTLNTGNGTVNTFFSRKMRAI